MVTKGPVDLHCTAFLGERMVASGNLEQVVPTVIDAIPEDELCQVLIFDDSTSERVEVDRLDFGG